MTFGPIPDQIYFINGEYFKKLTEFSADTDTPRIPERFHMLIVYKIMMYYGGFESAPEVFSRGSMSLEG